MLLSLDRACIVVSPFVFYLSLEDMIASSICLANSRFALYNTNLGEPAKWAFNSVHSLFFVKKTTFF